MPQYNERKSPRYEGAPYPPEDSRPNARDNRDKRRSPLQNMADAGERKRQLFETFNTLSAKMTEDIKEYEQKIMDFGKISHKLQDKNTQDSYRATSHAMRQFAKKLEDGDYPYMNKEIVRQFKKKLTDAINDTNYYADTRNAIILIRDGNIRNFEEMHRCMEQITNNMPNNNEKEDLIKCKKQYDDLSKIHTNMNKSFNRHRDHFSEDMQRNLYYSLILKQEEKQRIDDWLAKPRS